VRTHCFATSTLTNFPKRSQKYDGQASRVTPPSLLQIVRAGCGDRGPPARSFLPPSYAHLLDDDLAPALGLEDALWVIQRVNAPGRTEGDNLADQTAL
jgi:hypothetical protein